MKELDSLLVKWVRESYRDYDVNIAIKNSSIMTSKEPLIHDRNDIFSPYSTINEMKLALKLVIYLVDKNGRNVLKSRMDDLVVIITSNPKYFFHQKITKN